MTDAPLNVAAARRAWDALAAVGGVVSRSDLQERWSVTQQRVQQVTAIDGFPEPCSPGRSALWLAVDVEQWRREREARPGKPGRKPKALVSLDDRDLDLAAAHQAWASLQRAGGIVSTRDLATRWSLTDRGARSRTSHPAFPKPIAAGRWLAAEVEAWRRQFAQTGVAR